MSHCLVLQQHRLCASGVRARARVCVWRVCDLSVPFLFGNNSGSAMAGGPGGVGGGGTGPWQAPGALAPEMHLYVCVCVCV